MHVPICFPCCHLFFEDPTFKQPEQKDKHTHTSMFHTFKKTPFLPSSCPPPLPLSFLSPSRPISTSPDYPPPSPFPLLLCMSFSDCKAQMRNDMRHVTCNMCAAYSGCRQLETVELAACSQLATLTLKPLAAADHPKSAATRMFDRNPIFPPIKNQPRQVRKFELNSIFPKKIESGKATLDLWSFSSRAQVDIGGFWDQVVFVGLFRSCRSCGFFRTHPSRFFRMLDLGSPQTNVRIDHG